MLCLNFHCLCFLTGKFSSTAVCGLISGSNSIIFFRIHTFLTSYYFFMALRFSSSPQIFVMYSLKPKFHQMYLWNFQISSDQLCVGISEIFIILLFPYVSKTLNRMLLTGFFYECYFCEMFSENILHPIVKTSLVFSVVII